MCILLIQFSHSQKESAHWYFGDFAGLDFNNGSPVPKLDGALSTKEGCATISDSNGNLLFYTDGKTVWDRTHNIMPNGTGLLGDSSSTESAIIIPNPGNSSSYYIFTTDKPNYYLSPDDPIEGANYSEVNMDLNNGLGDLVVTNKNNHLITYNPSDPVENEYKSSEKLTAINHSNGQDVWVITHFKNKFYAFKVTASGVEETPYVSTTNQTITPRINEFGSNVTAIGYLKVSPDGKKIAIAHSSTTLGSPNTGKRRSGKVFVYDFNNTTGAITNQINILENSYPYGVEFSPNSKLLYVTATEFSIDDDFLNSKLLQYNMESGNIPSSKTVINTSQNVAGALQLGIDGKIYRAGYIVLGQGNYLSVINNPNQIDVNSNYSHNTFYLNGRTAQIGLPPFNQSIFKYSFDFEDTCYGDNTHFVITSEDPYDSVIWDFGDGNTSTQTEPYHTYSQPGNYTVSLTMSINAIEYSPLTKTVVISALPNVINTTYDLVECDSFDSDPNNQITTFDLHLADSNVVVNEDLDTIEVFYYNTLQEATDDIENENALPYSYTNQSNNEVLVAKVTRKYSICYSIAYIKLIAKESIDLGTYTLETCDTENNGTGIFNLDTVRNQILNDTNLTGTVNINFFQSVADAQSNSNLLPNQYNSVSRTIIFKIDNENVCYGQGQVSLQLSSFPTINDQVINVCESDFPINISTDLSTFDINNYQYTWNTNQTTETITINQEGIYGVTITDPILQCEKSIQISVFKDVAPEFTEINIQENTAIVELTQPFDQYEYAMDNPFGPYQSSNVFANLTPGTHKVFVRDLNQCNTISRTFNILGFPSFFSPNNSNNMQYWNVKGLGLENKTAKMYIYNRYGKLLYAFNPLVSNGWDGKYNNKILPQNDYWYVLKLTSGKTYKGHFTLIL